jgi:hypothetical protein
VNVFGHDHISVDGQAEAATHPFQDLDEEITDGGGIEPALPMVTSKGHEVRLCGLLKTLQAMRHRETLRDLFAACSDG